jgi:hypothetical protein
MLGTAGLASVALMLAILARLTRRWQAVTRTRSYYRWFYVAGVLVALAALARLVRIGYLPVIAQEQGLSPLQEPSSWFYLAFYHLPLVIAATISLLLAWRNWGWLFRVQEK